MHKLTIADLSSELSPPKKKWNTVSTSFVCSNGASLTVQTYLLHRVAFFEGRRAHRQKNVARDVLHRHQIGYYHHPLLYGMAFVGIS